MTPDIDFSNIRAEGGDRREGFEEFCCQIFQRYAVPVGSRYERFRGAGGDGGVEAVWSLPGGDVVGLQSKFFLPLKTAHKAQLEKSLDAALDNHPKLATFIISLPLDPTPTVKARAGKSGEAEKLEDWRKELVSRAKARTGATVNIVWWTASELKSRLLAMDGVSGRIRYWFGGTLLDQGTLETAARVATAVAGKRYSPKLSVEMEVHTVLRAFAQDPAWRREVAADLGRSIESLASSWSGRAPKPKHPDSISVATTFRAVGDELRKLTDGRFAEGDRQVLEKVAGQGLEAAGRLVDLLKAEFDEKHGAASDTPGWRQFQAEMMAVFPAGELDLAREVKSTFENMIAFAASAPVRAAGCHAMLMRGPAGVGKTHTIIDFTKTMVEVGRGALTILGQEITVADDPWRMLASRLGLPRDSDKTDVVGLLSARAETDGAPFLVLIDAVNETPDRSRWRAWLPDLEAAFNGRPIRLLVSCRDIFVADALDTAVSTLAAVTHDGFAGREYEAAYAFAAFYKVGPPAEIIAQPEFANPLFLHLVCRASQARGWSTISGGQTNLTALITAILDGANVAAASALNHDPRFRNLVREGAEALAAAMAAKGERRLSLAEGDQVLQGLFPSSGASTSLLHALEAADLITAAEEGGTWVLRFAFERLGDMLIAQSAFAGVDEATIQARFSSGDLAALIADEATIVANAGLLQAYSIILPEQAGIELAQMAKDDDSHRILTRLALDVIAWRDVASFGSTRWFTGYLNQTGNVAEILDQILAVAATPSHPLNVDWLGAFLWAKPLVERDCFWNYTVTESWRKRGSVHRLIRTAQAQDLTSLSPESARRLGTTLAWFCASSDREIRENAIEALARLMIEQHVSAQILDQFGTIDDDYVLEAVMAAVYGAGLRRSEREYWRLVAAVAYRHVFDSGRISDNVLVRDLARLIVEEAHRAGLTPPSVVIAKTRPPYTSGWPLTFRFPDWTALAAAHPDYPSNMLFAKGSLASDFARYEIKPRVRDFDLASAGLDENRLYQWVFEQVLDLGYPGPSNLALTYDKWLVGEHGSGRGRTSATERLGKKYSRVALARLVGRLHDNLAVIGSSWSPAPRWDALQGVEMRAADPTRLSSTTTIDPQVDLRILFPSPTQDVFLRSPRDWTPITGRTVGLSSHGDDSWIVLAGERTCHLDDEATGDSRSESGLIRSDIVPKAGLRVRRTGLKASPPSLDLPECYDVFLGEYPFSRAYETAEFGRRPPDAFGTATTVIVKAIEGVWIDRADVWCPAPALIDGLDLVWDGDRGWIDDEKRLVAVHIKQGRAEALLLREASLETYLSAVGGTLIWSVLESRNAAVSHDPVAYEDRTSAWERRKGGEALLAEHVQNYFKADDCDDEDGRASTAP